MFGDERDIFFTRRMGMFVTWGLFAIPAWHEQILWRKRLNRTQYEKYIDDFNPSDYDPDKWIDAAESAGMEYICFVSKHHDGFCMWDTKYTDYNVMNTPYGKDILGMLAEACQRRNFPLSIYYSCPDWHHPNYPNLGRHHELFGPRPDDNPDIGKYYKFVKKQIEELCSNYGKIYQFFWDINVAEYWDQELINFIRSLQPGILINDRGPGKGDYSTPERHVPEGDRFHSPTEGCQSLGRLSWGYKKDELYYSYKYLMQSIDKILAMGGNYLLNVGPTAQGTIAKENLEVLNVIGNWYSRTREAFYDTVPATHLVIHDLGIVNDESLELDEFLLTRKDNIIYVHLHKDPISDGIIMRDLDLLPKSAVLLNNGEVLNSTVEIVPRFSHEKPYLIIRNIPVNKITGEVLVIKLEFDEYLFV